MTKVFLFLMLMSSPNQPSVKYNAYLYPSEEECILAKDKYINLYNNKTEEYKSKIVTNGYCIPFDSFPVTAFNKIGA
jgi:hypothetical protein